MHEIDRSDTRSATTDIQDEGGSVDGDGVTLPPAPSTAKERLARRVFDYMGKMGSGGAWPPYHEVSEAEAQKLLDDDKMFRAWVVLGRGWVGDSDSLWIVAEDSTSD